MDDLNKSNFSSKNSRSDSKKDIDESRLGDEMSVSNKSDRSKPRITDDINPDQNDSNFSGSNKTVSKMGDHESFNRMEDNESERDNKSYMDGDEEKMSNEMSNDEEMDERSILDDEYKADAEILDQIIPERNVRHRMFRFINKLRNDYKLQELHEDFIGNQIAMQYASYLMSEKENEAEITKL